MQQKKLDLYVDLYGKNAKEQGFVDYIAIKLKGELPIEFKELGYKYFELSRPLSLGEDEFHKAKLDIEERGFYKGRYKIPKKLFFTEIPNSQN